MTSKVKVYKQLLTVSECAEILKCSPSTIYNGIANRSKNKFPIRPIKLGKKAVRFDYDDVLEYIDSQKKLFY
jgi:excisionase family DNA binding protein